MNELTRDRLAAAIDHTLLKPEATPAQVDVLCREALEYRFASVCINSVYVPRAADILRGSPVKVCTVNGFPLGACLTGAKVCEARESIERGATEIDTVLAVGLLKGNRDGEVEADIRAVAEACHAGGALLKVIIEACLLTDDEKVRACRLAQSAGADFVKTSTGFSTGGATAADVRLMRETVGPGMGVKAAGGIRTLAQARAMLDAGATRIGASAGVAILRELG